MNIITHQHYSDIWTAYDDDSYDGPGSALGHGKTEQEAIGDLMEQLADRGIVKDTPELDEGVMLDSLLELSVRLHTMYAKREADWKLILELGQSLSIYLHWRVQELERSAKHEKN